MSSQPLTRKTQETMVAERPWSQFNSSGSSFASHQALNEAAARKSREALEKLDRIAIERKTLDEKFHNRLAV